MNAVADIWWPNGEPKAHVERDFLGNRIKIHLAVLNNTGSMSVLQGDGTIRDYQPSEAATTEPMSQPYLQLPDGLARALLDALEAHYGGVSEHRQLRRDYDAERTRVDRFIAHLTRETR